MNHKRNCHADSKDDSEKMPSIYKQETHKEISLLANIMFTESLHWVEVSQRIEGACCSLSTCTLSLVAPDGGRKQSGDSK